MVVASGLKSRRLAWQRVASELSLVEPSLGAGAPRRESGGSARGKCITASLFVMFMLAWAWLRDLVVMCSWLLL